MDKVNTKTLYEDVFPGTIIVSETKNGVVIEKEYTSLKAAMADASTHYDTYEFNGKKYLDMTVIHKSITIVGNQDANDYQYDRLHWGNFAIAGSYFRIAGSSAEYLFDGRSGSTLILHPRSGLEIANCICNTAIYNYDIILAGLADLIVRNCLSGINDLNGGNGALAKITATATSEIIFNKNKGYGVKGAFDLIEPTEMSPIATNRNVVTITNSSDTDLIFDVHNDDGDYSFADSDVVAGSVKIEGAESITIETNNSSFKVGDKVLFDTSVSGAVVIDNDDIN